MTGDVSSPQLTHKVFIISGCYEMGDRLAPSEGVPCRPEVEGNREGKAYRYDNFLRQVVIFRNGDGGG